MKILIFDWNTASVPLCETMDDHQKRHNRSGLTTWQWDSHIPDFWDTLSARIAKEDPDLVVIGFQEDRRPGSYFHSHFLPAYMPGLGYELFQRETLMGVGVTTVKNTLENGYPILRGLRTSIYVRSNQKPTDGKISNYVYSSGLTRSKGGMGASLTLDNRNLIFINCHLPFQAYSLIEAQSKQNPMIRQNYLHDTNIAFNNIYEHFVLDQRTPQDSTPTVVFYFGDFNYRVDDMRGAEEVADEMGRTYAQDQEKFRNFYLEGDEMISQMRKGNIYSLDEGVEGRGPEFLPTCKLSKNRRDDHELGRLDHLPYKLGKHNQRRPSWCDRIVYTSIDAPEIRCLAYEHFDVGETMAQSDHAAVLGIFTL